MYSSVYLLIPNSQVFPPALFPALWLLMVIIILFSVSVSLHHNFFKDWIRLVGHWTAAGYYYKSAVGEAGRAAERMERAGGYQWCRAWDPQDAMTEWAWEVRKGNDFLATAQETGQRRCHYRDTGRGTAVGVKGCSGTVSSVLVGSSSCFWGPSWCSMGEKKKKRRDENVCHTYDPVTLTQFLRVASFLVRHQGQDPMIKLKSYPTAVPQGSGAAHTPGFRAQNLWKPASHPAPPPPTLLPCQANSTNCSEDVTIGKDLRKQLVRSF